LGGVRRFKIVPGSSSVDTEVRSSVHPIQGKATELRGVVEGEFDGDGRPDLDRPYQGWVEIPVAAIKSGNRITDIEMQRRAEARTYPDIRFEVGQAWTLNGSDRYRARLTVTAHGRTQSIEEDFRLRLEGRRLVLEGQHTFDMRDFGVNPPRILTLKVDPAVRVRVRLVADEEDEVEK
jgi:polyisoprenoid-binding protein YceI